MSVHFPPFFLPCRVATGILTEAMLPLDILHLTAAVKGPYKRPKTPLGHLSFLTASQVVEYYVPYYVFLS